MSRWYAFQNGRLVPSASSATRELAVGYLQRILNSEELKVNPEECSRAHAWGKLARSIYSDEVLT